MALATLVLVASAARACIWDSDTLRDERRGLPGIAEVLAGRMERHSAFFYEDRAKRSSETIEREPTSLAAWDDLAVACEKLGQVDRAIETIEKKAALKPSEYTTEANWGTFLIHRGDYDAGLAHLRRALEINPDAHFGRERYQVMAVEYVIAGKADASVFATGSFAWPIVANAYESAPATQPEDDRLLHKVTSRSKRGPPPHAVAAIDKAIKGVVGMLRFGPGTSPHLYAALGDLLIGRGDFHLAYRTFLRAREAGHPSREWIDGRLATCQRSSERKTDFDGAVIADERTRGAAWTTAYQAFEDDLVRRGIAVDDAALARLYEKHGTVNEPIGLPGVGELWFKFKSGGAMTLAVFALVLVAALVVMKRLRRPKPIPSST